MTSAIVTQKAVLWVVGRLLLGFVLVLLTKTYSLALRPFLGRLFPKPSVSQNRSTGLAM